MANEEAGASRRARRPRASRQLALAALAALALPACQILSGGSGFEVGEAAGGSSAGGGGGTGGSSAGGGGANVGGGGGGGGGGGAPGSHLWSIRMGGQLDDGGAAVATDASGNVYLGGAFTGSMAVGGYDLTGNGDGMFDGFIAKLDPQGAVLWAQVLGGPGDEQVYAVAVDAANDLYVVGAFTGVIDIGGTVHNSNGMADAFVASFDAAGQRRWSMSFGGMYDDSANDVGVQPGTGTIGIIGSFRDQVAFPDKIMTAADVLNSHAPDVFLLLVDPAGTNPTSVQLGDQWFDHGASLAFDPSGNMLLAGFFGSDLPLSPPCTLLHAPGVWYDIFLIKLDPGGACLWAQRFGDTANDTAIRVAAGPSGEVLLSGQFSGQLDLGGTEILKATPGDGEVDGYVASYTANGAYRYGRRLGGMGEDAGADVVFDSAGNGLVSGFCTTQVDFGQGLQGCQGGGDGFLLKMAANGDTVWSKILGGANLDVVLGLGVGPNDEVIVSGTFTDKIDIGGGDLVSAGGADVYAGAFAP